MNVFQKLFLIIFVCIFSLTEIDAKEKEFWFVCITHDKASDVNSLTKYLKKNYIANVTKNKDISLILYYPNGTEPYIVKFNTQDENSKDYEEKIVTALYNHPSQTIYAHVDLDSIGNLFNSLNVFSEELDRINFSSVQIDFFASKQFLELGDGYGRSLIEKLYFAFDIQKMVKNKQELSFNVYCEGVDLSDPTKYFGEINPDGFINCVNIANYNE